MNLANAIIAVDFDGTCVTHEYPAVGKDIGAVPVLRELTDKGAKLILWTMRSGDGLEDAKEWFRKNNIPLWGANTNPTQHTWSASPKAYAHLYIDDMALGAPLKRDPLPDSPHTENRPYIDWEAVRKILLSV